MEKREFNLPLFLLFLDLEKAYDRVDRNKLLVILEGCNLDKPLINFIKSLYTKTMIQIKSTNQIMLKPFEVNMGVH
jgi:hypothetical protein